jgi:hypothetical protein
MKSSAFTVAAGLLACTVLAPVALADPDAPPATQATPAAPATATAPATQTAVPAPATAPAAQAAAASSSAASGAPTVAAAPAAAATSTDGENLTSELREKHFKAEGYHVKMRGDQKYFCRVEQPIGSHFSKEQCFTEDVLARGENLGPSSASMGTRSEGKPLPGAAPAWTLSK